MLHELYHCRRDDGVAEFWDEVIRSALSLALALALKEREQEF
jgi:hypothetical protein